MSDHAYSLSPRMLCHTLMALMAFTVSSFFLFKVQKCYNSTSLTVFFFFWSCQEAYQPSFCSVVTSAQQQPSLSSLPLTSSLLSSSAGNYSAFNVLKYTLLLSKQRGKRPRSPGSSSSFSIGSSFYLSNRTTCSALHQKRSSGARLTMGVLRRFYIGNYI